MKKIISILLFACAGALAACDFLDVVPEGQATQEDIFKTSKEARKYLNTLYTYAPNIAAIFRPVYTPMATAVASSMASSARVMPEMRSPYIVSRTAVVIASPESSGIMPPMIAAFTL